MQKKYTLEDFNSFERNENGFIVCPAGDYTVIEQFPKKCSFGERCSFGKECKCEQKHEFKRLFLIGYIGSRDDTTQFWLLADNSILVRCGCFCGSIDEFKTKVLQTHKDNHYAKEYLAAAVLAKLHFGYEEQGNAEK